MSHTTYNNLWAQAQRTLEEATQVDTILQTAKPQKDKRAAQQSKFFIVTFPLKSISGDRPSTLFLQ